MSIYVQSFDYAQKQDSENQSSNDDDDSSVSSERVENDEETVMAEGDMVFDDSDMEDDDDGLMNPTNTTTAVNSLATKNTRRICSGPSQDNDFVPVKRIPPQVHLARFEAKVHRLTNGLANELVHVPLKLLDERSPSGVTTAVLGEEEQDNALHSATSSKKKKKKLQWDDFDKLLGLRERHPNPVFRITSAFLGPLMRMFRITLYAVRVSFNVSTWRDPFLSFWVLAILMMLFVILFFFPWRAFLFITGWISLGPQVCWSFLM